MRNLILCIVLGLTPTAGAGAADLYKVTLHSHHDANILKSAAADVLMWVRGGYLILADDHTAAALENAGLNLGLVAADVRRDQLAMDGRFDRKNAEQFEVLYEDSQVRLLLAGADRIALSERPVEVFPLPDTYIEVAYYPGRDLHDMSPAAATLDDIADLIAQVEQDSLESYVNRLQAFYRRLTGTDSSYAARDWIAAKFSEFGYESIVIDPFIGSQLWDRVPCQSYNVIAYKPGAKFPDQQIIIGGHFDAVPDCPGADDNASGTATVLEVARILKDVETDMTFIFIAFDSEESWMWGSYHYVDGVIERNDDIVLMINPDMVAHETNSDRADLYYGAEDAYARLWRQLASTYVGITGDLSGSTASDHLPFQQAGYDVIFVQEKFFSTHYHLPSDSTTHMDFEYMTRMVKATLATLYSVDRRPPPIRITSVLEPGDGQSQIITWQTVDPSTIDHYRVSWFRTDTPTSVQWTDLPPSESSCLIEGLVEEVEYSFFVQAYDAEGNTSYAYDCAYGIPNTEPEAPCHIAALPVNHGIEVTWQHSNTELDFDHIAIIRDGDIIAEIPACNAYVDDDQSLGSDLHYYYVTAVDSDGNHSDTVGIDPVWMKAAVLDPERILAVNRTTVVNIDFVDEKETGAFMREALAGYNFDYYSDTAAMTNPNNPEKLNLTDMVDYGLIIVGAEAARYDEICLDPAANGILDTLAYYLSIGGKVIVFGRWGDLGYYDIIDYTASQTEYDDAYHDYFHIDYHVQTTTLWNYSPTIQDCDLVGAFSQVDDYPDLAWDSVATVAHSTSQYLPITGTPAIPCANYAMLQYGGPEVIYTYDSKDDDPFSEGKAVGWRYLGSDYQYVFFDMPLSFFSRGSAIQALQRAVEDLTNFTTDVEPPFDDGNLPGSFALSQNYPNPFNPNTVICFTIPKASQVTLSVYNILGQRVAVLFDGRKPAGNHSVTWDGTGDSGSRMASGIYFYQMQVGDYTESRKMLLLK